MIFEGTRENILHLFRALLSIVYFAKLAYTGFWPLSMSVTVLNFGRLALILNSFETLWRKYFYHGGPVYLLNPIEMENTVTETESVMDKLLFNKPITVCTLDLCQN